MSGSNKREHVRTKLRADVTVSHPELGDLNLHTGDISDGGAYILSEGHQLPPIGEMVSVQVQGMGGGDAPVVKMKVVRLDNDGVGLAFVNEE
ncbi:PilZ domain-containing protein [Oceanicoccus sagamiensis]|uniref:PilZ domain-containing protein n=1 Tax=Oceanicoccus sagamiensis TaxID=716816 RepID=UPI00197F300C|nr:PilZ domain-containing protein [Oceanicoccus sagamiensis]